MHYAAKHTFERWVTTLLDNHYQIVGYLKVGLELRELMRKLHGSVAKMVNDVLSAQGAERRVPFWRGRIRGMVTIIMMAVCATMSST
jgi:hypothetical protein